MCRDSEWVFIIRLWDWLPKLHCTIKKRDRRSVQFNMDDDQDNFTERLQSVFPALTGKVCAFKQLCTGSWKLMNLGQIKRGRDLKECKLNRSSLYVQCGQVCPIPHHWHTIMIALKITNRSSIILIIIVTECIHGTHWSSVLTRLLSMGCLMSGAQNHYSSHCCGTQLAIKQNRTIHV